MTAEAAYHPVIETEISDGNRAVKADMRLRSTLQFSREAAAF
jgi:hypothetical protein